MPITKAGLRKSLHQEAFNHYLRTGERLTNAEWLARCERKFNPYHDEIGRFTSPPGVTVSYGSRGGPDEARRPASSRRRANPHSAQDSRGRGRRGSEGPTSNGAIAAPNRVAVSDAPVRGGVDAELARDWSPEAPIVSRFDLNQRQFHLDTLRQKAGPNPSPGRKKAFEEAQRRLDAARARLDENDRTADREVLEILRAGAAPADLFVAGANVFSANGEVRDYLSVVGAVPVVSSIRKMGKLARLAWLSHTAEGAPQKLIQLGGAFRDIQGLPNYNAHHNLGRAVSPLSVGDGPSIAMLAEDHQRLVSSRGGRAAEAFRKAQADHLAKGDIAAAIQMDIDDIRKTFGNKYDESIGQMLDYSRKMGWIK